MRAWPGRISFKTGNAQRRKRSPERQHFRVASFMLPERHPLGFLERAHSSHTVW